MKKIIISTYDEPKNPYYGGGGAYAIHELAKSLSKKYTIEIICGKYPHYKDYSKDGIFYHHVGLLVGNPYLAQLAFQVLLPFYCKKLQFDLWFESFTPPFSTAMLPLFTTKPIIGLAHMLAGVDMKRKYHLPFDIFEKIGLRVYRNIIAVTPEDKKKILSHNPHARVTVIPNGIHLPKTTKGKATHILYIGRTEINQKGLDMLLKAYSQVVDTLKLPLFIAGTGTTQEVQKLQMLISKFSLQKHVKLQGKVAGSKKEKMYRNAAMVVLPSRFETFSLVALESLMYAKPLVTFDIPGLSWIPKKYRIVVKSIHSRQLANALITAASKKLSTTELRSFVRQFSISESNKKYYSYIQDIFT